MILHRKPVLQPHNVAFTSNPARRTWSGMHERHAAQLRQRVTFSRAKPIGSAKWKETERLGVLMFSKCQCRESHAQRDVGSGFAKGERRGEPFRPSSQKGRRAGKAADICSVCPVPGRKSPEKAAPRTASKMGWKNASRKTFEGVTPYSGCARAFHASCFP